MEVWRSLCVLPLWRAFLTCWLVHRQWRRQFAVSSTAGRPVLANSPSCCSQSRVCAQEPHRNLSHFARQLVRRAARHGVVGCVSQRLCGAGKEQPVGYLQVPAVRRWRDDRSRRRQSVAPLRAGILQGYARACVRVSSSPDCAPRPPDLLLITNQDVNQITTFNVTRGKEVSNSFPSIGGMRGIAGNGRALDGALSR